MTRIRYTQPSEGILVSRPLIAGEHLVTVTIDTINNNFKVHNESGTLAHGEALDVAQLKKKAKLAAAQLGVVFQDEVRRRGSEGTTEVIA